MGTVMDTEMERTMGIITTGISMRMVSTSITYIISTQWSRVVRIS
jgi:hypothetical protein